MKRGRRQGRFLGLTAVFLACCFAIVVSLLPAVYGLRGGSAFTASAQPLTIAPFLDVLANDARLGEETRSAIQATVLKRDPRNILVRRDELQRALTQGQAASALAAIDSLLRIDPGNRDVYADAVVALTQFEQTSPVVAEWLTTNDEWHGILGQRLRSSTFTAGLYPVYQRLKPGRDRYLFRLINEGRLAEAYAAWLSFRSDASATTWPFNGEFDRPRDRSPFDWVLIEREQVEITLQDTLAATHFGNDRTLFAWQVMAIAPGTYELATELTTEQEADGSFFVWEIQCVISGARWSGTIVKAALSMHSDQQATVRSTISIPKDCPFQRLQLFGEVGLYPIWSRAEISSVRLSPTNSDASRAELGGVAEQRDQAVL